MIIHPSYFIDIESLVYLYHSDRVVIELHDSYLKQTYRNRCCILAANGKLNLTIPILRDSKQSSLYKDILIDNRQDWKLNHLKSIKSAYQSSPYFEFYEDDLLRLYQVSTTGLLDWNIQTLRWIMDQLNLSKSLSFTTDFYNDELAAHLIKAKREHTQKLSRYIQVFQEKHGYVSGLCSLDLLFNLGPASSAYLNQQQLGS
ncbi:MAG: WbqC family protein [Nonlabens sp.]